MDIIYSTHQARARLSELLRHVRDSKTVTITYRGEPVAEVRPLEPEVQTPGESIAGPNGMNTEAQGKAPTFEEENHETMEERLEDFRRRGILVPAKDPTLPLKPGARVPGAQALFLAERGEWASPTSTPRRWSQSPSTSRNGCSRG